MTPWEYTRTIEAQNVRHWEDVYHMTTDTDGDRSDYERDNDGNE
jgi:hypothetical protein